MSLQDYAGRTTDLLLLQGDFAPGKELRADQALVDAAGVAAITTGAQKLAQRLLLILLTKKGSIAHLPDFGTLFMVQAERGLWRTAGDVQVAFYAARLDLMRQLRAAERPDDPPDERALEVTLQGVTLDGDRIVIRPQLKTAGGTTYIRPIAIGLH